MIVASSAASAVAAYVSALSSEWKTGVATEHTYRPHLKALLETLLPRLAAVNEPRHVACGAPDFILRSKAAGDAPPVFFVETKDLNDGDLDGLTRNHEQFSRYKAALGRIVFTDYLDFRFYSGTELVDSIRVANVIGDHIVPAAPGAVDPAEKLAALFSSFAAAGPLRVSSPSRLASLMAAKARLLAAAVRAFLEGGGPATAPLESQRTNFRKFLLPDLDHAAFADLWAQTVVYGLFVARLHDKTPEDFSRTEAAKLIPKSNLLLRETFQYVSGDLDGALEWIVDDLVNLFSVTDVAQMFLKKGSDPAIHFYEDFLAAYNPALRKARGVWFTPAEVVRFIVRAVDSVLKESFGLPDGLACADPAPTRLSMPDAEGSHLVQILDPATGTGAFLVETVRLVHDAFSSFPGAWPAYALQHLLPRLHGFELLMSSYAMAHLRLELAFRETGCEIPAENRIGVCLANTLEDPKRFDGDMPGLFSIQEEAKLAARVKSRCPVMVVMGNPPYSVSSSNRGKWIDNLIADYKKDLGEKKINLDDDYIKFIRYGQWCIDRTGEGVLAYISNNSFLDGITHRRMRLSLMESFDEIRVLDLHGNARKKETAPDGSPDKNVFDIMQGVSINLFVKKRHTPDSPRKDGAAGCRVFHSEIFGSRENKYETLEAARNLSDIAWTEINPAAPYYFFVPKDLSLEDEYRKGVSVAELFRVFGLGVKTERDDICIHHDLKSLKTTVSDFSLLNADIIRSKYGLGKDSRDWSIARAKADVSSHLEFERYSKPILVRAFDTRWIYYPGTSKGFVGTPAFPIMKHMLHDNLALCLIRNSRGRNAVSPFVAEGLVGKDAISTLDNCRVFPLWLYEGSPLPGQPERVANLAEEEVAKFATAIGRDPTPEELFDYIYAVLHSPQYRERYAELLKIDFPRIPLPSSPGSFERLAALGHELRETHLLRTAAVKSTAAPLANLSMGTGLVENPVWESDGVRINEAGQRFENVPEPVWTLRIGGYEPAQKWLKDRKGRTLSYDDIAHYKRLVNALAETRRIVADLDA